MEADRELRGTPMEAQRSMEIGVLTFPGVSKQHILCHWTLQSGNQNNCVDRNDGVWQDLVVIR
jgi:hypothetical protein